MSSTRLVSGQDSGIARRRRVAQTEGTAEYMAKRREVIRVGATVFQEKGYGAATLNDVAVRLGTDRASLYYYVGGKEDLFHAAVQDVLATNLLEAERILNLDADAVEKLRLLIQQAVSSYEAHYPYMYLYIQEDVGKLPAQDESWALQMRRERRRFESMTRAVIEQGMLEGTLRDDVRVDLASNALFGMLNWTHRWFQPGRSVTGAQLADSFCAIFLDGMRARR
jgi:AcrR family transcriptional regulator